MSMFDEPWRVEDGSTAERVPVVVDRMGVLIARVPPGRPNPEGVAGRTVACVNALVGVQDPAEFARQYDAMVTKLRMHEAWIHDQYGVSEDLVELRELIDTATKSRGVR